MVGMDISTNMDVSTEMQIVMPENSLDKHSEELNKDTKSDGKRQRCDTSANISYVDVMTNAHVSHDDNHWDLLRGVANSLMEECMKENAKIIEEFDVDDVIKVEVDTKEYLRSFSDFYDKGVIMFFTGRIPYLSWIKQWLPNVMNTDCVLRTSMQDREVFMKLFYVLKSIVINCLIDCLFSMGEVWSMLFLGDHLLNIKIF